MMSVFYNTGKGVKTDLEKGVEWYQRADSHSDRLFAQMAIARHYEKGYGFAKDENEAMRWYHRAASQGMAQAQAELGDIYSMQKDFGEAFFQQTVSS